MLLIWANALMYEVSLSTHDLYFDMFSSYKFLEIGLHLEISLIGDNTSHGQVFEM